MIRYILIKISGTCNRYERTEKVYYKSSPPHCQRYINFIMRLSTMWLNFSYYAFLSKEALIVSEMNNAKNRKFLLAAASTPTHHFMGVFFTMHLNEYIHTHHTSTIFGPSYRRFLRAEMPLLVRFLPCQKTFLKNEGTCKNSLFYWFFANVENTAQNCTAYYLNRNILNLFLINHWFMMLLCYFYDKNIHKNNIIFCLLTFALRGKPKQGCERIFLSLTVVYLKMYFLL